MKITTAVAFDRTPDMGTRVLGYSRCIRVQCTNVLPPPLSHETDGGGGGGIDVEEIRRGRRTEKSRVSVSLFFFSGTNTFGRFHAHVT